MQPHSPCMNVWFIVIVKCIVNTFGGPAYFGMSCSNGGQPKIPVLVANFAACIIILAKWFTSYSPGPE